MIVLKRKQPELTGGGQARPAYLIKSPTLRTSSNYSYYYDCYYYY